MQRLSVVIITKNEAGNIRACIRSARTISDDIIVVDAESEDNTVGLATGKNVRTINLKWNGYGNARNAGAAAARYEWIFSLDADERITQGLVTQIQKLTFCDPRTIYGFRRRNYFEGKEIKYGTLAHDKIWRLYNRQFVKWDGMPVHEKLCGSFITRRYVKQWIDHYTIESYIHYKSKSANYAYLCALKYLEEGRTASFAKRFLASKFDFFKSYFLLLGFLDGKKGLSVASVNAYYTRLKYEYLHELNVKVQSAGKSTYWPTRINLHSFPK